MRERRLAPPDSVLARNGLHYLVGRNPEIHRRARVVPVAPYYFDVPISYIEDVGDPIHLQQPEHLGELFAQFPEFARRYSLLEDRVDQIRAQQEGRPIPPQGEFHFGPATRLFPSRWRVEFDIVLSTPRQVPYRVDPTALDQEIAFRWLTGEFGPPRVARERFGRRDIYSEANVDPETLRLTIPEDTLQDLRVLAEQVDAGVPTAVEETGPGTPIEHPSEYRREWARLQSVEARIEEVD